MAEIFSFPEGIAPQTQDPEAQLPPRPRGVPDECRPLEHSFWLREGCLLEEKRPPLEVGSDVWVASSASERKTLPGHATYSGTPRDSIAWDWTGEVCVRMTR